MSSINLTCDFCGKEIKSITYWSIGEKLCAKCYHEMLGNPAGQYVDMLHKEMSELKISNLERQIRILEKALELACETIKSMCPRPLWIGGTIPAPEVKDVEYFKDIAKEMMKSE